jgi:hypothetical protein
MSIGPPFVTNEIYVKRCASRILLRPELPLNLRNPDHVCAFVTEMRRSRAQRLEAIFDIFQVCLMLRIMNTMTLDTIAHRPALTSSRARLRPQVSWREDKTARVIPGTEPVGLKWLHGQRRSFGCNRQTEFADDSR